jgi:hypothetical protein
LHYFFAQQNNNKLAGELNTEQPREGALGSRSFHHYFAQQHNNTLAGELIVRTTRRGGNRFQRVSPLLCTAEPQQTCFAGIELTV